MNVLIECIGHKKEKKGKEQISSNAKPFVLTRQKNKKKKKKKRKEKNPAPFIHRAPVVRTWAKISGGGARWPGDFAARRPLSPLLAPRAPDSLTTELRAPSVSSPSGPSASAGARDIPLSPESLGVASSREKIRGASGGSPRVFNEGGGGRRGMGGTRKSSL